MSSVNRWICSHSLLFRTHGISWTSDSVQNRPAIGRLFPSTLYAASLPISVLTLLVWRQEWYLSRKRTPVLSNLTTFLLEDPTQPGAIPEKKAHLKHSMDVCYLQLIHNRINEILYL